jgi:hypothetical protein
MTSEIQEEITYAVRLYERERWIKEPEPHPIINLNSSELTMHVGIVGRKARLLRAASRRVQDGTRYVYGVEVEYYQDGWTYRIDGSTHELIGPGDDIQDWLLRNAIEA